MALSLVCCSLAYQAPPQGEQADSWGLAFVLLTLFLAISVMYFLHWSKFRYMPESVGVIAIGTQALTSPRIGRARA